MSNKHRKFYIDKIYGFEVAAFSKEFALKLINARCALEKVELVSIDQIMEVDELLPDIK